MAISPARTSTPGASSATKPSVDRVQVRLCPVVTGQTGLDPIFQGAADFDLELVESRTLDGHIQDLSYRPTLY